MTNSATELHIISVFSWHKYTQSSTNVVRCSSGFFVSNLQQIFKKNAFSNFIYTYVVKFKKKTRGKCFKTTT